MSPPLPFPLPLSSFSSGHVCNFFNCFILVVGVDGLPPFECLRLGTPTEHLPSKPITSAKPVRDHAGFQSRATWLRRTVRRTHWPLQHPTMPQSDPEASKFGKVQEDLNNAMGTMQDGSAIGNQLSPSGQQFETRVRGNYV
eukprot:4390210-Amphidinium_carterae.2